MAALRIEFDNREVPGGRYELISTRFVATSQATLDIDGVAPWSPPEPPPRGSDEYEIRIADEPTEVRRVRFEGLLPAPGELPDLDPLFREISPGLIRYLGPYRERVARQHRLPVGTPAGIGTRGDGVPGLLANSQVRGDGTLLERVNEKLARIVPGWRIEEMQAGSLWSTMLVREGSRSPVNLADAGSGLAQVLPILVQCAADEMSLRHMFEVSAPLQIIEEPEAHLHPAAHAELADLYLKIAATTGTQFLIETHSETLLLRLRRRIAEVDNDYGPETVAIYVVEQHDGVSSARRVELDSLGNLDESWPPGYFSQDYHEVRALAAAQSERTARAS